MEATTSKGQRLEVEERGAGGKYRKPSWRRPPTTPYARPQPPPHQNEAHRSRWLSKLVDPAYRLIAGGANLILPSFLSKSEPTNDGDDNFRTEGEQDAAGDDGINASNHIAPQSTGAAGTGTETDNPLCSPDFDGHENLRKVEMSEHNWLPEIEQLIKQKNLSRAEIDHLLKIIHSRAVDPPEVEREKKISGVIVGDNGKNSLVAGYVGKPNEVMHIGGTSNDQEKRFSRVITEDDRGHIVAYENSRKTIDEKPQNWNGAIWENLTPLKSTLLDVGASPVEIARAYMENRTPKLDYGRVSVSPRDEGATHQNYNLATKPFDLLSSPKSSICWPGATVQDRHAYMTPQNQSGKLGLHSFARTPYARSRFSMSNSKVSSRGNLLDDRHGSVGTIRRMRHSDVAETPRQSVSFNLFQSSPEVAEVNVSEGSRSTFKMNLERGINNFSRFQTPDMPQISDDKVPTVPAHSSQMARKILEQLDRNVPTPRDKSTELKLATYWKKPQSSDITTISLNKNKSSTHWGGLISDKSDPVQSNSPVYQSDNGNTLIKLSPREVANDGKDVTNNGPSASGIKMDSTVMTLGSPSVRFLQSHNSKVPSRREDTPKGGHDAGGSMALNSLKKPPSLLSGTKPVLPSITVGKHDQRWTASADGSLGFSFPISASSAAFSDLPTPSVMPSAAMGGHHQLNDGPSVPSYTFGSKKSSSALVFSFPSTSNAPFHGDSPDLKFNFGSDKTSRISFSSIGKDAICY
ncbi:hypothetical protein K2173_017670 [Erythroxylum novogranatense]|uniref:Nuclear pore complex protein n=1 Tax=Erythroxylum novogranatense TaxID=1862640 RepID=A0AAV8SM96_9ROSI|nr:hypothetical protein K2173_017670 [Erythroxylum novogranatense]